MTAPEATGDQAHWQGVYRQKDARSVSWYQPHLRVSIDLLRQAGLNVHSRVIDVGGGASTLVDDLLAVGLSEITVLDLSADALQVAQARLGERASRVHWQAGNLLDVDLPQAGFDFWHDRAVLHFLTDGADTLRYAEQAARAVAPGGYAVIGGFGLDGPERCSGLPVARRSPGDTAELLAPAFRLLDQRSELHQTPDGRTQSFGYALLQRVATP